MNDRPQASPAEFSIFRRVGRFEDLAAVPTLGTPAGPEPILGEIGGNGEVRPYTVFLRTQQLTAPAGLGSSIRGRIIWAIEGAEFEAEVDALGGARVALVADRVTLRAQAEGGGVHRVHGAIVEGAQGEPLPATRTRFFGAIAADATTGLVAIPAFAVDLEAIATPVGPAGGFTVELLDAGGTSIGQFSLPTQVFGSGPGPEVASQGVRIPIPGDAAQARIVNGTLARAAARLVFRLRI